MLTLFTTFRSLNVTFLKWSYSAVTFSNITNWVLYSAVKASISAVKSCDRDFNKSLSSFIWSISVVLYDSISVSHCWLLSRASCRLDSWVVLFSFVLWSCSILFRTRVSVASISFFCWTNRLLCNFSISSALLWISAFVFMRVCSIRALSFSIFASTWALCAISFSFCLATRAFSFFFVVVNSSSYILISSFSHSISFWIRDTSLDSNEGILR